jgi:hypothetical protein
VQYLRFAERKFRWKQQASHKSKNLPFQLIPIFYSDNAGAFSFEDASEIKTLIEDSIAQNVPLLLESSENPMDNSHFSVFSNISS